MGDDQIKSVNLKYTPFAIFSCLVASISMFNINYNFAVINIPQEHIKKCNPLIYKLGLANCLNLTEDLWSYVVSIISFGGFFGCFIAITLSNQLGRRRTIIYHNLGYIVGGLVISLTNNYKLFLFGRFLIGVTGSISQISTPMYIAEIATVRRRGLMSLIGPVIGDMGTMVSLFLSLLLNEYFLWRILLGLTIIPGVLQMILGFLFVESPRYMLVYKNDKEGSKRALQKLRQKSDIADELKQMNENIGANTDIEFNQLRAFKLLFTSRYFTRFLLVALILAGQGLSGITVMDYYSQPIVASYYSKKLSSILITVFAGLGILISFSIMFCIDKVGRKTFLVLSQTGVGISCLLIALGNIYHQGLLVLLGLFFMRVFYGLGLSCIPFIIASEFFPTYLVSGASGIVMGVCWISHFVTGKSFKSLEEILGDYVFITFFIVNITVAFVLVIFMPETRGKSLEEIDCYFSNKYHSKSQEFSGKKITIVSLIEPNANIT